jgi:hypothetical protein
VTLVEIIIEENNDAIFKNLTELLDSKTAIKVSISTMEKISNQLNYTSQKTPLCGIETKRTSSKIPS